MDRRHIKGDERRVVVTGLGVVSPYGRGCEVYWQGLAQGQCLMVPSAVSDRWFSLEHGGTVLRRCVLWPARQARATRFLLAALGSRGECRA